MSTGKPKMGCAESVLSDSETKEPTIFSRNSKVTEFLKLCIQPRNNEEMEGVLLKFWEKFESLSRQGDFSEIDVVCMFVLNHAYQKPNVSLSSMSRSLFAYQRQVQVRFFGNTSINPSTDCFLKELRDFENVYRYSKCHEMLVDVGLGSVLDGGLGLTLFLIKFGLMKFPAEDIDEGKKMVEMLVFGFNGFTDEYEVTRRRLQPEEMLYRMRRSDIRFRRALILLCVIVIVAEYDMHEKMQRFYAPSVAQQMKEACILKLKCVELVVSTTTETKIILRDIENFVAKLLSGLLHGSICRVIMEAARKLFRDVRDFHNPRTLKDLARCKIRSSLQKRRMLSEQVNQLEVPDTLKEYLLFQRKGIWNLLKDNHLTHNLHKKVNASLITIGNIVFVE